MGVGRDEIGIALYDEVEGRRGGLDEKTAGYDNVWDELSPGERRVVEGSTGDEVVELLDAYADAVREYNAVGDDLYGPSEERTGIVTALLPDEMVLTDSAGEHAYLAAPEETMTGGDAVRFSSWLRRWHDRVLTADGYERFERKLEQAGFAGRDTTTEDALYEAWDEAGIAWGLRLWSLIHVPELDVPGKLQRRRELSEDVAAYAQELEEWLDPGDGVLGASKDEGPGALGRAWRALRG